MKKTSWKSRLTICVIGFGLAVLGALSSHGATIVPNTVTAAAQSAVPPSNIAASTTDSSTTVLIDTRRVTKLPLQLSFKTQGATTNTSGLTFSLYRSVDGSTYETTAWASYTLSANSTTTVVGITNVDCTGVPYLKLATWVNGNSASALTNITLKVAGKADSVLNTPSR